MPAEDRNKPKDARRGVRLDDFIANAVPDPRNVGETLFLTGFVGASSQSEHTRIYSDASLSSYVDVKTSDIVHSEALSEQQSPLGGSYIWLKRDAEVYFGSPGQSTKGKFLQGPLTAAYGGQFGAAGANPAIGTFVCNTFFCTVDCYTTRCSYFGCSYGCPPVTVRAETEPAFVPPTGYCFSRYCPPRPPHPQVAEAGATPQVAIGSL